MTSGKPYPRIFDFEDWMEYDIYFEKIPGSNERVMNDSSNYSLLIPGKLTYNVWNQIQLTQKETYYKMRDFQLCYLKKEFTNERARITKEFGQSSARVEEIRNMILSEVNQYIASNSEAHQVLYRPPHRGIPYGAKYLTPRYVKQFHSYKIGSYERFREVASIPSFEAHRYNTVLRQPDRYSCGDMFPGQLDILVMDAMVQYRDWLTHQEESFNGATKLPFNGVPDGIRVSADRFCDFEHWLLTNEYLDPDGKWIKEKQDIAALLQLLIDRNIFGELKKNDRQFRSTIRKRFEDRYNSESIAEQFKPNKVKNSLKQQFIPGLLAFTNPTTR